MHPKDIVRLGYDAASYHYRSDEDLRPGEKQSEETLNYHQWLDLLEPLLPPGASVLDLGCGCGLPVTRRLARHYPVTGIDLSEVQCARAQQNAPQARILCADMTQVQFPQASFDAVVAFFSLIHLPLPEQPGVFQRIAAWLRPGGFLMVTLPVAAWTGTEEDWHGSGATMYWSHAGSATYLSWLEKLGFQILGSRFLPEGEDGFDLVLAQKPGVSRLQVVR